MATETEKYELIYFNLRGLAETSRILLSIGGVKYKDTRYPFSFLEDGKVSRAEFDADKAAGKFMFGQIPILKVDGVAIAQSKAIERYLAREFGLYGSSSLEAAQIDSYCEEIVDLRFAYARAAYVSDPEAKKVAKAAFYATDLPKFFGLLESVSGDDGHFFGGKLTLPDVQFFSVISGLDDQDRVKELLGTHAKLGKIVAAVGAIPGVAQHLATRPVTLM